MIKNLVGNIEIYTLIELEAVELIGSIIENANSNNLNKMDWLIPNFIDNLGNIKAIVGCYIVHCNNDWIL